MDSLYYEKKAIAIAIINATTSMEWRREAGKSIRCELFIPWGWR